MENERAKDALKNVKAILEKNEDKKQQTVYKAHVKKLAPMIQVNGLAQTMAFYLYKQETIYEQIRGWIMQQESEDFEEFKDKGKADFVQFIIEQESEEYRRLTMEVIAYVQWLARFADGLIEKEV